MSDDLSRKLRKLKSGRTLKPADSVAPPTSRLFGAPPESPPTVEEVAGGTDIKTLLPNGRLTQTPHGACYIVDTIYPLAYRHGTFALEDLLDQSPTTVGQLCDADDIDSASFTDYLFIDTETTGLAGAGTIPFMVGVGFFDDNAFVVRQYFLRDHGDEAAMLYLLDELASTKSALVSFNGRSFDLPLIANRFIMNRSFSDMVDLPHFDLLHPSRRVWSRRLGSCSLGNLETAVLGLERTHEDVPGWYIPTLYTEYIRTGDARELVRVFYHNRIDMLSMVTLTALLLRQFASPLDTDNPTDLVSTGKWQVHLAQYQLASDTLTLAMKADLSLEDYHLALEEMGWLLKRQNRRADAIPHWRQWAATTIDDVTPHIELAKYYEWHEPNLPLAQKLIQEAITLLRPNSILLPDLEHRLNRLAKK